MKLLSLSFLFFLSWSCYSEEPPVAKKIPHIDSFHNDPRVDNYRWMHDNEDPEVKKHLEAETAYAKNYNKKYKVLQENLAEEYKQLRETSAKRYYKIFENFSLIRKRDQKESYWRWYTVDHGTGKETLILDGNEIAKSFSYFAIFGMELSPDQKKILFIADLKGRGHGTPFLIDLETNKVSQLKIDLHWHVYNGFTWVDNTRLLFVGATEEMGLYQIYDYVVSDQKSHLVASFKDKEAGKRITKTFDGTEILIRLGKSKSSKHFVFSRTRNQLSPLLDTDKPSLIKVNKNKHGWFKHTNEFSDTYGIYHFKNNEWVKLYKPKEGYIANMFLSDDHVIVEEGFEGAERLTVIDIETGKVQKVPSPTPLVSYRGEVLVNSNSQEIYYEITSFTQPSETYSCYLKDCKPVRKIASNVPGIDPSLYATKKIQVKARDGELIPVSVYYRKDMYSGKDQRLHLYGYGSYGAFESPRYEKEFIPMLNRGVIGAIAHIRGGREKGERWYDQGRYLNKMNTFNDFIDVAEHFVKTKVTKPEYLAINGLSAGGLLMGAVMNMRPDLFRVAYVGVPFVDILNTMTLYYDPLSKYEKKEWGDGLVENEYYYMKAYDPYTNVKKQKYPSMIVVTGFEDTAVYYFQPMKWVAKLREYNKSEDSNPIVFFTTFKGGHGGDSGNDAKDKDYVRNQSFVLGELGFTE